MVTMCVAPGCGIKQVRNSCLSFHKFPLMDKKLLKRWVDFTQRKGWTPTIHSVLCSLHFTHESFKCKKPAKKKKHLKQDAVPSIVIEENQDDGMTIKMLMYKPEEQNCSVPMVSVVSCDDKNLMHLQQQQCDEGYDLNSFREAKVLEASIEEGSEHQNLSIKYEDAQHLVLCDHHPEYDSMSAEVNCDVCGNLCNYCEQKYHSSPDTASHNTVSLTHSACVHTYNIKFEEVEEEELTVQQEEEQQMRHVFDEEQQTAPEVITDPSLCSDNLFVKSRIQPILPIKEEIIFDSGEVAMIEMLESSHEVMILDEVVFAKSEICEEEEEQLIVDPNVDPLQAMAEEIASNYKKEKTRFLERKREVYKCNKCEYITTYSGHIKRHKLIHTSEKPFSCSLCPLQTTRLDNLNYHIRVKHRGDKPLCCDVCSFTTKWPYVMKTHMNLHTEENIYKCELCPYTTLWKFSLKTHMARHYNLKPYLCEECPYKAISEKIVKTHMLAVHSGEKPYTCSHCSFSTSWKAYLKTHEAKHCNKG